MAFLYGDLDRERWVVEPPKSPERSDFARDRARLLHSAAWRRLAGKTQVMLAGVADFPRTRMTHSLECAQVGRELGAWLGADPDLVEVGCLAHDLGHPPFGHNGEEALAEIAAGIGGFEANAQTFRLLTRLEAKTYSQPRPEFLHGRSAGLNLCRATLDAACKYPWPPQTGTVKFGVYPADLVVFEWMRAEAPLGKPSFEAQIMDWADDVAYSVHDLEDGIQAGHIVLSELPRRADDVVKTAVDIYAKRTTHVLGEALERLLSQPLWHRSFQGRHRELAELKNLTSQLIGRFSLAARTATRARYGTSPLGRFEADLIVPSEVADEVAVLKAIAHVFVMNRATVDASQARQRRIVHELVATLVERGPKAFDPEFAGAWRHGDDAENLRLAIDQVACLTDTSVMAWHQRLISA